MVEKIIPTPKKVELEEGLQSFPFAVYTEYEPWKDVCRIFATCFEKAYRKPLAFAPGGFTLKCDPSLKKGSYRIDSREGVTLYAADDEGIRYAVVTALQMVLKKVNMGNILLQENGQIQIERALIEDWAEKDYRGLMVDVAREWHPARTLLPYVDVCFMLKIKYLHIHFIDDQRYTLPSKAYPRICQDDRHYTFEDIKKLNDYAKEKGIILIPEFEAPGHAAAMNRNYPEIFANEIEGDGVSIYSEEGELITADNVICAGKEECFEACKTLLQEMCEMFPDSPYIHIGGDEANIKAWNYCADCKKYMKEHGIANEKELYSEFIGRIAQAVLDMGRTPIVWEGFPKEGVERVPKETIVVAWESYYHLAPDLLKAGFKIINCAWSPLYIIPSIPRRWNYLDILNWSVYRWTHFWPNSPATLNPITVQPTEQVLGGFLASWECTYEQEISRIMENLPAVAEKTWTVDRVVDDTTFRLSMPQVIRLMSLLIVED